MSALAVPWGIAFILSLILTLLCRRLALRLGLIDRPAARKAHRRPTPLLGGLAMLLAIMGGAWILRLPLDWTLPLAAIAAVGFWDDRFGLSVRFKLAAQILIAAWGVLQLGGLALPLPAYLAWTLTVLWIVGLTNAVNLLDNVDGAAALSTAWSALFLAVLASGAGATDVAALAVVLSGACGGFLVFNWPPASIFMGDGGSLPLGLGLATLAVGVQQALERSTGPWTAFGVLVLCLCLPIFDTALVVVSRLRRGLNPLTAPGKDHSTHRLLRLGLSRRGLLLVLSAVQWSAAGIALCLVEASSSPSLVLGVLTAVSLSAIGLLFFFERQELKE